MVSSVNTRLSLFLAAVIVVVSSAFTPSSLLVQNSGARALTKLSETSSSSNEARREFVKQLGAAAAAFALSPMNAQPARAGLLDDFGSDPTKIAAVKKKEEEIVPKGPKKEVEIEPTLKGTYYYPTAKKRYLPRIQKVTEKIGDVSQYIANGQWEEVQAFAAIADNAVLPMQLYVSSLDGQGLSMSNSYAKVMKKDALEFEKQFKNFQKAIKKQDKDMALAAVQEMGVAVVDYRQAGRLKDDDGNIPDVAEIRRSTMRRTTQAGFALDS